MRTYVSIFSESWRVLFLREIQRLAQEILESDSESLSIRNAFNERLRVLRKDIDRERKEDRRNFSKSSADRYIFGRIY